MHDTQQLWLAWGRGEIDDTTAQTAAGELAAEAAQAPRQRQAAAIRRNTGRGRDKVFGHGRCVPLDRNAKVKVMMLARALMRRTDKGKHYGAVTSKFVDVLRALLWGFHNAASGKCFPSYESIADRAACSRTTVYSAIRALEQLGILTWVNRIKRVREWVPGLFGKTSAWRWSVQRTSNAYAFNDPSSKFKFQTGTTAQDSTKERIASSVPSASGFRRLGKAVFGAKNSGSIAPEA